MGRHQAKHVKHRHGIKRTAQRAAGTRFGSETKILATEELSIVEESRDNAAMRSTLTFAVCRPTITPKINSKLGRHVRSMCRHPYVNHGFLFPPSRHQTFRGKAGEQGVVRLNGLQLKFTGVSESRVNRTLAHFMRSICRPSSMVHEAPSNLEGHPTFH